MRIAIFHSLALGGAQNMAAEFAMRLGRSNIVDVYYLKKKEEDGRRPLLQNIHAEMSYPFAMTLGAPNLFKNLLSSFDYMRLLRISRKVAADIDSKSYDVVLLLGCRYMQTPLIIRYLHTPILYYCAEPWRFFSDQEILRKRPLSPGKRLASFLISPWLAFLRKEEIKLPSRAAIVFTHSKYTQSLIKNTYSIDARLCRLGIDMQKYSRSGRGEPSLLVLSIGAVCWVKGHEDAIRAIARIDKSIKPTLMIIGHWADASESGRLTALARELGVDTRIEVGKTSDQDLVALYSRARMALCLAHSEPFGLIPLEAMACSLPVVAVHEGGYPETVIDGVTGYLVERNIDIIAAKIQELFNDEAKSISMGAAGFDYVSRCWSWSTAENTLKDLLIEAAETSKQLP